MKSEVEFGSVVYADGTISKRTRLHFDSEDAMWSYYDSLEKGANA